MSPANVQTPVREVLDIMRDPDIVDRTMLLPSGKMKDGHWAFAIPEPGLKVLRP